MFEIELLAKAEDEMADAYEWYEEQQTLLGSKFYNEINYYLNLIELNPFQFPIKYIDELRSASLKKFPYVVIYWVNEPNRKIYIVSIFHTSRKPQY